MPLDRAEQLVRRVQSTAERSQFGGLWGVHGLLLNHLVYKRITKKMLNLIDFYVFLFSVGSILECKSNVRLGTVHVCWGKFEDLFSV